MSKHFRNVLAGSVIAFLLLICPAAAASALFTMADASGKPVFAATPDALAALPSHEFSAILPGSGPKPHVVKGPLLRDVIAAAGLRSNDVIVTALDGYEMAIPASDITHYDLMVALEVDGVRLSVRDRGPAWIVYPNIDEPELQDPVYEARSVWQVKQISVK